MYFKGTETSEDFPTWFTSIGFVSIVNFFMSHNMTDMHEVSPTVPVSMGLLSFVHLFIN
jgi:hypothetical protein